MTHRFLHLRTAAFAMALSLGACGGGGGGVNSTPLAPSLGAPPSATLPPKQSSVDMLETPATQEFTTFSVGQPLRIRYDATAGQYEVMAPRKDWDALIDDPQSDPGLYLFASMPNISSGYVSAATRYNHPAPELRYRYSSLASWALGPSGSAETTSGAVAFGAATPAGGVPLSGSASYQGIIRGTADIAAKSSWGDSDRAPVGGTVALQFDFERGSLAGQIKPQLACECEPINFPTLNFVATIFANVSPTFSGKFDTAVGGANAFAGLFTGPRAEELIGKWTFPFMVEQVVHSATGVWIAKRGN